MEKLIILIPLEKVGLEQYVQTFSLFSLFSLFVFPFLFLYKKIKITLSLKLLLIFISWLIFSTIVNFYINQKFNINLFRALLGLLAGIAIFITLRYIYYTFNEIKIFRYFLVSYLIVLFYFFYDLIFNFPNRFRIYSSYTEPSHLGTDLILIYLPIFLLYNNLFSKIQKYLIYSSFVFILILTFSATSFLKFFIFIFLLFLLSLKEVINILKIIGFSILCLIFFLVFMHIFPNNYLIHMTNAMITSIEFGYGAMPISFTDRFSFWILLFNLLNLQESEFINLIFGFGLGSDEIYLEFLPEIVAEQITLVKAFSSYITSFWGRIFSYGGVIGMILFSIHNIFLYKKISKLNIPKFSKNILYASLTTLLFSMSFDLGPFQTIANWLIPAYIDGMYIKNKTRRLKI